MPLLSLIYISRSAIASGQESSHVDDIVAISRINNPRHGLTGALLFTGEHFAQVLEGTAASIDQLMAQVAGDVRHDQIITIARERISARRFSQWSMAYSGPSRFVAHHVTRLLNRRASPAQNRHVEWLNDLMWEFADGSDSAERSA